MGWDGGLDKFEALFAGSRIVAKTMRSEVAQLEQLREILQG